MLIIIGVAIVFNKYVYFLTALSKNIYIFLQNKSTESNEPNNMSAQANCQFIACLRNLLTELIIKRAKKLNSNIFLTRSHRTDMKEDI